MARPAPIIACLSLLGACVALGRATPALAAETPSREDVGRYAAAGVFPFVDVLYAHDFKPLGGAGPAFNGLGLSTGVAHAFWVGSSGDLRRPFEMRFHGLGLSAGVRGAVLAASCPDCSARATAGALVKVSYLSVVAGSFRRINFDSVEAYAAYSPWVGTDRLGGVRELVSGSRLMLGANLPDWMPRFVETMLNRPGDVHGGWAVLGAITSPVWFPLSLVNQLEVSLDLPHCSGAGCAARLGLSTGFHW